MTGLSWWEEPPSKPENRLCPNWTKFVGAFHTDERTDAGNFLKELSKYVVAHVCEVWHLLKIIQTR